MLTKPISSCKVRYDYTLQDKGKRNTPLDKSRARIQTHSRPLQAVYCTLKQERRFAKRIQPRIARRGSLIMCIQKCTIRPVSDDGKPERAAVGSTAQAMPTPPAVPSPLWTPPNPGIPPNK